MKISMKYGDIMRLAQAYGKAKERAALNKDEVGELSDAHDALEKAVMRLEYLAFKQPPCKICVNADAQPVGEPCCDCFETAGGWSKFVEAKP